MHLPKISTDAQIKITSLVTPERILNMVIPAEPQRTDSMDKMAKQSPTPPIAIRQWGIAILQY
jgi:hypothetical protein